MRDRACVTAFVAGFFYLSSSGVNNLAAEELDTTTTHDSPNEERASARHRLDLTTLFLDEIEENSATVLFGYTYNLTKNSNLNLSLPYIDSNVSGKGGSGIGDLSVAYSFVPFVPISAKPWIPRTVGSGLSILFPTANAEKVGGFDTTVISPFLGLAFPLSNTFAILPSFGYSHSVEETSIGTDVRLATAELGISYVTINGFWINYFPEAIHDLETDNTAINHRLTVGKELSRRFGLSLDYSRVDRVNFTVDLPTDRGFDTLYEFNLHFTF